MSKEGVDAYLDALEEPKRSMLAQLRASILAALPGAEEGVSYGMPAFRLRRKVVAGFAAFKGHLRYFPHSGSVIAQVPDAAPYATSKGTPHFVVDEPLSAKLVEQLLAARISQALPDQPPWSPPGRGR